MSGQEQSDIMEFPCDFPIKAMGVFREDFELMVVEMVRKHCPDLDENAVHTRDSKGGKYLSVTVTIRATSRDQLDNIYQELTDCEHVLMAL